MIVSLTGYIEHLEKDSLVLNVRGMGFEIGISSHCCEWLQQQNKEEVSLLTRFVVREDKQALFGFYSSEERLCFDMLCSVSGVGPRLALGILSAYTPRELFEIIRLEDISKLVAVSGVGKKMASRLMIELKEQIESNAHLLSFEVDGTMDEITPELGDVIDALVGMGFERDEAYKSLRGASSDALSDPKRALSYALKQLGGGLYVGSRS